MTKECQICKKEFYVKPSHSAKRKTCSLECRVILQTGKKLSEEHKIKIGEGVKKSGVSKYLIEYWKSRKGMKRPPITEEHRNNLRESHKGQVAWNKGLKGFLLGRKITWADKISEGKKKGEKCKGEKAWNWNGGSSFEPYPPSWTKTFKKSIRIRDNYRCMICGISQKEYGIKNTFPVHHIDYDKNNCDVDNLITLCNPCHMKTNFNKEYWLEYLKYGR